MQESYLALVRFLLPEGILDYFELSKIVEGLRGLHIYLEEKNLPPAEYKDQKLESKGWAPPASFLKYTFRIFLFVINVLHYALSAAGGKLGTRVKLSAEIGMWCNRGLG